MRRYFFVMILAFFTLTCVTVVQTSAASLPDLASEGQYDKIKEMIPTVPDIDQTDRDGRTVLHWMAMTIPEQPELVTMLLENGADVSARNRDQNTPLHYAAERGALKTMEILLSKGADISAKNKSGETPLHRAFYAEVKNPKVVTYLLEKGADVNTQNSSGETPFMIVNRTEPYNTEMIVALFAAKPDVNIQDVNGVTALMHSIRLIRSSWQIPASMLNIPGIDVNLVDKDGRTALHYAVITNIDGNDQIVRVLVNKGANVNVQDKRGKTPLLQALEEGNRMKCVAELLHGKADPKLADKEGNTPLYAALSTKDLGLLDALIERGADVNAQVRGFGSVISLAANNYPGIFEFLLKKGTVDLEQRHPNSEDRTILLLAVANSSASQTEMLLEAGANVNVVDKNGRTALHILARGSSNKEKEKIAKLLLAKKPNVNVQDEDGWTPIFHAASRVNVPMVELLYANGADLKIVDKKNQTVVDVAKKTRDSEQILKILEGK